MFSIPTVFDWKIPTFPPDTYAHGLLVIATSNVLSVTLDTIYDQLYQFGKISVIATSLPLLYQ